MRVDLDKLTFRELLDIEEKTGKDFSEFTSGELSVSAMAAIVWVIRRRDNPDMTWDDALQLNMEDAADIFGADDDEDEDPTEPDDDEDAST